MKRLVILAIAVAVFGLATPQMSRASQPFDKTVVMQNKEVKYTEIKSEDLPEAVTNSIAKDYSGYAVDEAYKGDDGSYKVLVSNKTTKYTLFYGKDGNLIKVEQPSDKK